MPRIRSLDRAEKSIAVRVTEQLHDALFRLATEERKSVASIVRPLIEREIARWERKQEKSIDEY